MATVHKLVFAANQVGLKKAKRPGTGAKTPEAMRTRELAWILFILAGAEANIEHALLVNAYTMKSRDLALVRRVKREVQKCMSAVRAEI